MKKTILKIFGLVVVATLMVLNIQFTSMDEGSMISLSYLKNLAFAQGGENGGGDDDQYPKGQRCGSDPCSVTCGIPPFTYTAEGSWWHCKWTTEPGTCSATLCERACDARCFK